MVVLTDRLDKDKLALLCVVMWRVWFLRNQLVHNCGHGGHQIVEELFLWSSSFMVDFKAGNMPSDKMSSLLQPCLAAGAQSLEAAFSPQVAEATTILRGINFDLETGLVPCVIESNELEVIKMINSGKNISTDIGLIVFDIRDCFLRPVEGSMGHVSRKTNVVTHNLSKYALAIVEERFWMESYPPCLERPVQEDRTP
ncbi:hypothetical protein Ddye_029830 [Dipteronia dyeriana]|uniref:RNase H type-1 domain-containing protein n=1 Tax=Dipteronia dyeriana TaxID=168575 RepID=A0AAD9TFV8_9ROSI|nr:hypothetical protein Ddye_029830 [Dipteronia dyeriana]